MRELVRATIDEMHAANITIRAIPVDSQFGAAVGGAPLIVGITPSQNSKSVRGVTVVSDIALRDRVEVALTRAAILP